MKPYADLHVHPSFKPYLSHYRPDKRHNCWDELPSPIAIARSQGSLGQLKTGGAGLAVTPLYAIERPLTSSFLVDHVAHLLTVMDQKMLDFPSYAFSLDSILAEMEHLKRSQNLDPSKGLDFRLLNSIDDYEDGELNVILAIEGGHCLESFNDTIPNNLRRLKAGDDRFLYLTLIHMTQYPLASHAYAMKLIKNNDQFKPGGFGLTDLGRELIDIAYDESIGPRIFIDIKHMSAVSRFDFYQYRRQKGYDDIPILATHMGVTGISRDPRVMAKYFSEPPVRRDGYVEVQYDRPQGIGKGFFKQTYFNPWSINLYDEDITEVLDSGGLIGMNMDQRIQGTQRVKGEFFSAKELNFMLSGYQDKNHEEAIAQGEFTEEEEEERDFNETRHLRHLCNNILHIVKVGGERAWSQLCIGTDFDGLIDPINYCTTARDFPKLEEGLLEMLPQMMGEDKGYDHDDSNMEQKVRGIMYGNVIAFLERHFR